MKIIISHPTGNANVRAIVEGLFKEGLLEKFITTVAYFEASAKFKSIVKDINRREFDESLKPFTEVHPWKELGRHLSKRLGLYSLIKNEKSIFSIDAVYKDLDKHVSKLISKFNNQPIVYAYEDGSYYTFSAAKKLGLPCVYDLPIAYWKTARTLLMEEAERLPAWKKTLGGGIADSKEKLERKQAELEMADLVITPSSFVADSVTKEFKNKKIAITPFGTPAVEDLPRINTASSKRYGKLKVLFVGSMGQRKGLADLACAKRLLNNKNIEFVILGSKLENESFYKKELSEYIYEKPRSHAEVLQLMSTCDIFCLPSIVEGRALVMQEAMSCNLPIIITKNTGGEDLVIEGETGFLVPIRSPEAIAEKINWYWENQNVIKDMGQAASTHANKYTWQKYAQLITDNIRLLNE